MAKKRTSETAIEKKSAARKLTTKQQRFIDCYAGDIKGAAEKAGISYGYARNLMTKGDIVEAIRSRQETEVRPKDIADRQERQAFWTQMMRDAEQDAKDRLKASELLGRSEADFTENLSHKFPEGCGVMVVRGQMDPEKWRKRSEQHHRHGSGNSNPS
jgi:hypothetical protein